VGGLGVELGEGFTIVAPVVAFCSELGGLGGMMATGFVRAANSPVVCAHAATNYTALMKTW
jgi:hypothetical protein